MSSTSKKPNNYSSIIENVFFSKYKKGCTCIPFKRDDLSIAAAELGINLPKNLGDVLYSIRYRTTFPPKILKTQPKGMEWRIEGKGRSLYEFQLGKISRIAPNASLAVIKIPDSTPEIVAHYALSDEQALLAKVRYNRLLDIFLGMATYSLQNHLRTTVKGVGQVEIDEIYVGLNKNGSQYILPMQAKGGSDQLSAVQTRQDIGCCTQKFPHLICRAISAQFISNNLIALFELADIDGEIRIIEEKHYQLVPAATVSLDDLRQYQDRSHV